MQKKKEHKFYPVFLRDKKIKGNAEKLQQTELKDYEMRNVMVKNGLLFYLPSEIESLVLFSYHDQLGYVGIDKMVEVKSKSYWFPQARENARNTFIIV